MKKVIAIAGADFHIHDWAQYNNGRKSRLINSVMPLFRAHKLCCKYQVPFLFAGDWIHTPEDIDNETNGVAFNSFNQTFGKTPTLPFIAISGNHDMSEKNSLTHRSPTHLDPYKLFPNFILLDGTFSFTIAEKRTTIWGIPYYNNEVDTVNHLKKIRHAIKRRSVKNFNIGIMHTDLPGAETTSGFRMGAMEHLSLRHCADTFDLTLSGHIHRPKLLLAGLHKEPRIIMLGSPCHQNIGDKGIKMGLWKIYDDMSVKFIRLNLPKFIQLKEGEEGKDDGNYYIPFKTQVSEKDIPLGEFSLNQNRRKLATKYVKAKGIKSKAKKHALIKVLNES